MKIAISGKGGVGKTTLAGTLARLFARDGYNVLAIDADGRVYLKREEECVAACCGAPVVVINGHYHEKLTPAKVDELLDGLE